jgi:hypothetical protein
MGGRGLGSEEILRGFLHQHKFGVFRASRRYFLPFFRFFWKKSQGHVLKIASLKNLSNRLDAHPHTRELLVAFFALFR